MTHGNSDDTREDSKTPFAASASAAGVLKGPPTPVVAGQNKCFLRVCVKRCCFRRDRRAQPRRCSRKGRGVVLGSGRVPCATAGVLSLLLLLEDIQREGWMHS